MSIPKFSGLCLSEIDNAIQNEFPNSDSNSDTVADAITEALTFEHFPSAHNANVIYYVSSFTGHASQTIVVLPPTGLGREMSTLPKLQ